MGPGKLRTVIIKINLSLTPWSIPRKSPSSLAARFAMDLAVLAPCTCGCRGQKRFCRFQRIPPRARAALHGLMHSGEHRGPEPHAHAGAATPTLAFLQWGHKRDHPSPPRQLLPGGQAACTQLQSRGSWVLGVRLSKHSWFLFN